MDNLDLFFTNSIIAFFVVQYFQAHVGFHRKSFQASEHSSTSLLERKLFASPQISFLSNKTTYNSTSVQTLLSVIVGLGNINCYIFLIYCGYQTVWYTAVILLVCSVILNIILYALVKRKPLLRHLVSVLSFIVVPIGNLLLWIFR